MGKERRPPPFRGDPALKARVRSGTTAKRRNGPCPPFEPSSPSLHPISGAQHQPAPRSG
jgi:hypothetical protein